MLGNDQLGDFILGGAEEDQPSITYGTGQGQATIFASSYSFGQAQALILVLGVNKHAQAQGFILDLSLTSVLGISDSVLGRSLLVGLGSELAPIPSMVGQAQASILTDDYRYVTLNQTPFAYFPLNELSGTNYDNIMGTGDGTSDGDTITQGVTHALDNSTNNTAITFANSGFWSRIVAPLTGVPVSAGGVVTVTGWIKLSSSNSQMFFGWNVYDLHFNGTNLGFNTGNSDNYGFNATALVGKWVHIAAVFYHNQNYTIANKIYINGVAQTLSGSSNTGLLTTTFHLSGWGTNTGEWARGTSMDEVALFNRELTSTEIAAQYNAGQPKAYGQAQAVIGEVIPSISTSKPGIARLGIARLGTDHVEGEEDTSKYAHGQAQARILQTYYTHGQSQADILQTYQAYGQSQARIGNVYSVHGQSQALILAPANAHGQAQGTILAVSNGLGQSQADILQTYQSYGQANATIALRQYVHGQSQAWIKSVVYGLAQAQALIFTSTWKVAQAQALLINPISWQYGQAQAMVYTIYLYDSFSRTTSLGDLGSPNIGPDYEYESPLLKVNGSKLELESDGDAANVDIARGMFKDPYIIQFEFTSNDFDFFYLEVSDSRYFYLYENNNNPYISIEDDDSTTISLVNDETYVFKASHIGGVMRMKVWNILSVEPDWMITLSGYPDNSNSIFLYIDPDTVSTVLIDNLLILTSGEGQHLKQSYGQARAFVKANRQKFAQAQADILKSDGYGQAKAQIIHFDANRMGQAQAMINLKLAIGQAKAYVQPIFRRVAQARARIKILGQQGYGQANALIMPRFNQFAQAQARMLGFDQVVHGQATGLVDSAIKVNSGNAHAVISKRILFDTFTRTTTNVIGTPDLGSYQSSDIASGDVDGSQLVVVFPTTYDDAWADARVHARNIITSIEFTRSATHEDNYMEIYGRGANGGVAIWISNNEVYINRQTAVNNSSSSQKIADLTILAGVTYVMKLVIVEDQVLAKIWDKSTLEPDWMGSLTIQYNDRIGRAGFYFDNYDGIDGMVSTVYIDNYSIETTDYYQRAYAQTRARIKSVGLQKYGQAQAEISPPLPGIKSGQAQAFISKLAGYGQALATIYAASRRWGQAQAYIKEFEFKYGQARAYIRKGDNTTYGQAQAYIRPNAYTGNAQGYISTKPIKTGQAQALIARGQKHGQAKAYIVGITGTPPPGTTPPPTGPGNVVRTYIVDYNGYQLPGFATDESMESIMEIDAHSAAYYQIPFVEHMGLRNKLVSMTMAVWEPNYYVVKNKVQEAATIIRSNRSGYAPLYIQRVDRHYEALAKKISMSAVAGESERLVKYQIDFECKPWTVSDTEHTLTGTTTLDTDAVLRDLYSGGWTPTRVEVTGTNVTISGYTDFGEFAGYISISGAVSGLTIDSENNIVVMNGETRNDVLYTPDYSLYVGPGRTRFDVTGASSVTITYRDRWYL
jgi:hypothetical protein